MPYLSSIRINPMRTASRRALNNPHIIHGMVAMGLPDGLDSDRPLWRLDTDNPQRPRLTILTRTKPDWHHIVEQAGWPNAEDPFRIEDYTPLFTHLTRGREFAFRLTANPVQNTLKPTKPTPTQQRQLDAGRTRGFRVGHRTATHQLAWLIARTNRHGFTIPTGRTDPTAPGLNDNPHPPPDVRISQRHTLRFHKGNDERRLIVINTATFEGRLTITDPNQLRQTLITGIGPSKSYGCGLLTLAPLPATL